MSTSPYFIMKATSLQEMGPLLAMRARPGTLQHEGGLLFLNQLILSRVCNDNRSSRFPGGRFLICERGGQLPRRLVREGIFHELLVHWNLGMGTEKCFKIIYSGDAEHGGGSWHLVCGGIVQFKSQRCTGRMSNEKIPLGYVVSLLQIEESVLYIFQMSRIVYISSRVVRRARVLGVGRIW